MPEDTRDNSERKEFVPHVQSKSRLGKSENALGDSEKKYRSLFENMLDGFAFCRMIFDKRNNPVDFVYIEINDAFERLTGLKREAVVGKKVTEAIPGTEKANPEIFKIYGRVALTCRAERFDIFFKPLSKWFSISAYCPQKGYFTAVFEDITDRKNGVKEISNSLEESQKRESEISALLKASKAVLQNKEFSDSARAIFDGAKELIGAAAGYVALLSDDGKENEVLFLDAAGFPVRFILRSLCLFGGSAPKRTTREKSWLKMILTTANGRNSCLMVMCNSRVYCLHR